jgi:hypothetical protein
MSKEMYDLVIQCPVCAKAVDGTAVKLRNEQDEFCPCLVCTSCGAQLKHSGFCELVISGADDYHGRLEIIGETLAGIKVKG